MRRIQQRTPVVIAKAAAAAQEREQIPYRVEQRTIVIDGVPCEVQVKVYPTPLRSSGDTMHCSSLCITGERQGFHKSPRIRGS